MISATLTLPGAIVSQILLSVPPKKVVQFERVCRQWQDLCRDQSIWKYFCIKEFGSGCLWHGEADFRSLYWRIKGILLSKRLLTLCEEKEPPKRVLGEEMQSTRGCRVRFSHLIVERGASQKRRWEECYQRGSEGWVADEALQQLAEKHTLFFYQDRELLAGSCYGKLSYHIYDGIEWKKKQDLDGELVLDRNKRSRYHFAASCRTLFSRYGPDEGPFPIKVWKQRQTEWACVQRISVKGIITPCFYVIKDALFILTQDVDPANFQLQLWGEEDVDVWERSLTLIFDTNAFVQPYPFRDQLLIFCASSLDCELGNLFNAQVTLKAWPPGKGEQELIRCETPKVSKLFLSKRTNFLCVRDALFFPDLEGGIQEWREEGAEWKSCSHFKAHSTVITQLATLGPYLYSSGEREVRRWKRESEAWTLVQEFSLHIDTTDPCFLCFQPTASGIFYEFWYYDYLLIHTMGILTEEAEQKTLQLTYPIRECYQTIGGIIISGRFGTVSVYEGVDNKSLAQ